MRTYLLLLLMLAGFVACQKDTSGLKETDLLAHGLPVTIMAPDSADIKVRKIGGFIKDITVKGPGNYDLQILASAMSSSDLAKVKAEELASVKGGRYFSKIISEAEDGFLYETALDSSRVHYNFRHILLQGDEEIVFSAGMSSTLTQEEAERLYQAVK